MRSGARNASDLANLFAQDGPLAKHKSGYTERGEQLEMARAVEKTFTEKDVLLCDAPTGTGKSVAYVAPAMLRASAAASGGGNGEKIILSTATISLQGQLLSEDIPPVRAAVADLMGYPLEEGLSYSVMKGRANFLCAQRHHDTLRQGSILDVELMRNLDLWAAETETGDREDLDFPVPVSKWMEIASDGEDCAPGACPFREGCFYYAHRERAQEADILVVNHALLLANVASFGNIFDTRGRHLVIDEAHRLEEIMTEAFGARVTYPRVRYVMRQAKKKCENVSEDADGAQMAAELFFEELRINRELGSEKKAPRSYRTLLESLRAVRHTLANDPREEVNLLQGMVGRLGRDLASFYAEPDDSYAYAVTAGRSKDPTRKPYPELRSWLLDTAAAFRDEVLPLFDGGGVVLTSATLANGSSQGSDRRRTFDYARGRLGLEGEKVNGGARRVRKVREYAGREVFDYPERVLIYVEDEMEVPTLRNSGEYARACAERTRELLGAAAGATVAPRALVLLSTSRSVSFFRETFLPPDGFEGEVRFQGDDSAGRLVGWLRESHGGGGAVLVGTRTFWEGTDVSGLDLVVIDRAPFAPPDDPVVAALCERAGKDWFRRITLPKAQVAMRQGAGRLMRRPSDRGVIALLDPRISRKGWGKSILSSLPPAPRTSSLAEVKEFFAEAGTPKE